MKRPTTATGRERAMLTTAFHASLVARKHNRAEGAMVVPSAYLEVVIDVR
jgi:hypothetical protein